jgi:hypothetical protein
MRKLQWQVLVKMWLIETKVDLRNKAKNFNTKLSKIIRFINLAKKMYLVILVLTILVSLNAILPQAFNKSRANQFFKAEDVSTKIIFTPSSVIPVIKAGAYQDYTVYSLKEGETLEIISSRTTLKIETITLNNVNKSFKAGEIIVLPRTNGYLFGYNKDISKEDIKEITGKEIDREEGYILLEGENVANIKKEITTKQVRIEYKKRFGVDLIGDFVVVGQGTSDFTAEVNAFYNSHKGYRWVAPDGSYLGECVSLSKRWQTFIGASFGVWPGENGSPGLAFDSFTSGDKSMAPDNNKFYTGAVLNPYDIKAGDIVTTKFNYSARFSHTGIATGKVENGNIEIVEQNNPSWTGATQIGNTPISGFRGAIRYIKK